MRSSKILIGFDICEFRLGMVIQVITDNWRTGG